MAAGDSGFGDTFAAAINTSIFVSGQLAEPASIFVKLSTTEPTGAAAGTEVIDAGYSAANPGLGAFAASGQTRDNDAVIDFGTLVGGVTVVGIEIWAITPTDVEAVGRLLWIEITPVVFTAGEIPRIPIGDLNITVA